MRKIFILISFFVLSFNVFSEVRTYFSPEYDLEEVVTQYLGIASEKIDIAIYPDFSSPFSRMAMQTGVQL